MYVSVCIIRFRFYYQRIMHQVFPLVILTGQRPSASEYFPQALDNVNYAVKLYIFFQAIL